MPLSTNWPRPSACTTTLAGSRIDLVFTYITRASLKGLATSLALPAFGCRMLLGDYQLVGTVPPRVHSTHQPAGLHDERRDHPLCGRVDSQRHRRDDRLLPRDRPLRRHQQLRRRAPWPNRLVQLLIETA